MNRSPRFAQVAQHPRQPKVIALGVYLREDGTTMLEILTSWWGECVVLMYGHRNPVFIDNLRGRMRAIAKWFFYLPAARRVDVTDDPEALGRDLVLYQYN